MDIENPKRFKNLNLLKQIDVLVDGKFELDKKDFTLKFRGSSNQRIIDVPNTLKYKKIVLLEEYMQDELCEAK